MSALSGHYFQDEPPLHPQEAAQGYRSLSHHQEHQGMLHNHNKMNCSLDKEMLDRFCSNRHYDVSNAVLSSGAVNFDD